MNIARPNNRQNNNPNQGDCIEDIKTFVKNMGNVTKFIIIANVAVFFIEKGFEISNIEYVQWLSPVVGGQVYRLITSTFSHADYSHIFFNMVGVILFSPILEKHHGFTDYAIVNVILIIFTSLIKLGLDWVSMMFWKATEFCKYMDFLMSCSLGYSGIVYAYFLLWWFVDDTHITYFQIRFRKLYLLFAYLLINQYMSPQVTFYGHLSGILCALLLRLTLFTKDERICGQGKHNIKVAYESVLPYIRRNRSNNNRVGQRPNYQYRHP